MPGLCAVVPGPQSGADLTRLRAMLRRMQHYSWHRTSERAVGADGVCLGAVDLDTREDAALAHCDDLDTTIVFDGELYELESIRRSLSLGAEGGALTAAQLLAHGLSAKGPAFLTDLRGAFAAVLYNERTREVMMITDGFGMRPLYYAFAGGVLLIASEIKAIIAGGLRDTTLSELGIAQFFAFGQFLNEDTLFANVRALPAAACATFACNTGELRLETYRQVSIRHRSGTAEARHAVPQLLRAAVESQTAEGRVGLSLSGGLDARTILGLAPNPSSMQTVSVGVQGSIDHRGASELSRIVGAPHHAHILDERFLQSFEAHLHEMILLTDGHYLDQGIVMPTLQTYRDLGIDVLLRGHGGELLHMDKAYAYSMDSDGLGASNGDIEGWLYRHLSAYMLADVPLKVFSAERRALARQALDAAIAKQPEVDVPAQRVWQLFLTERLHRETALSMHKFWCFCRVRLPYLDPQFVDAVMELAPRDKIGAGLQCEILRAYRPEFLVVANSNTGARPDASEWATAFARLRLRAYAKLRVPGYQPYERLGLWLSGPLRPMVERILLGESALDRGVFDADGVKQLLARHFNRSANHTFFIMALLIFELGQQVLERPVAPEPAPRVRAVAPGDATAPPN